MFSCGAISIAPYEFYFFSSEFPATALTPADATSTVVSTTVAPTLMAVAATVTVASATATTAQPLQNKGRTGINTIRRICWHRRHAWVDHLIRLSSRLVIPCHSEFVGRLRIASRRMAQWIVVAPAQCYATAPYGLRLLNGAWKAPYACYGTIPHRSTLDHLVELSSFISANACSWLRGWIEDPMKNAFATGPV